jgi:hypothetical protein
LAAAGEVPYRRLLVALWVLVRTAGNRTGDAAVDGAAADCLQALREVIGGEPHVIVQERAGALFVNGVRIRPDVANFAAIAGFSDLLRRYRITELMVGPSATSADFGHLARSWCDPTEAADLDAALRRRGCAGISTAQQWNDADAEELQPMAQKPSSSQLGAVFTMQQFTSMLGPAGPLSGRRARAVLQAVLHGLLHSPTGLAPLAGVHHDSSAGIDALRACVLAVRSAEELGWSQDRCIAAGTLALLGGADGVGGDRPTVDLARAARKVVSMLAASDQPEGVLAALRSQGQLTPATARAMANALVPVRA